MCRDVSAESVLGSCHHVTPADLLTPIRSSAYRKASASRRPEARSNSGHIWLAANLPTSAIRKVAGLTIPNRDIAIGRTKTIF